MLTNSGHAAKLEIEVCHENLDGFNFLVRGFSGRKRRKARAVTQSSKPSPSKLLVASNDILELDRRRPGRIEPADLELIPLMRKPIPDHEIPEETPETWDEAEEKWEPRDPIRPSRGIALGVVLCIPIWLALGEIVYQLVK